jgi:hypothetical protein
MLHADVGEGTNRGHVRAGVQGTRTRAGCCRKLLVPRAQPLISNTPRSSLFFPKQPDMAQSAGTITYMQRIRELFAAVDGDSFMAMRLGMRNTAGRRSSRRWRCMSRTTSPSSPTAGSRATRTRSFAQADHKFYRSCVIFGTVALVVTLPPFSSTASSSCDNRDRANATHHRHRARTPGPLADHQLCHPPKPDRRRRAARR